MNKPLIMCNITFDVCHHQIQSKHIQRKLYLICRKDTRISDAKLYTRDYAWKITVVRIIRRNKCVYASVKMDDFA
jgi:hypothetical protein